MAVHYLEIVSNDVDTLTGLYERMHGLSFGPPDPDLGQARVATRPDGTLVGIRKPLAAHEQPIARAYLAVEDIQQPVKKAEDFGATIAYTPTRQGQRGTFAGRAAAGSNGRRGHRSGRDDLVTCGDVVWRRHRPTPGG
jgi:hypothetical protein